MAGYNDIEREGNDAKNMGGTKLRMYIADYNDILTHAVIGAGTNPEDKYIKTTAPVFKTGKKWNFIDVALHSGELTFESIGQPDGRAFNQKPVFKVPANNKKALPLLNSPNGLWVIGVPMANGVTWLIGDDGFPAEIIPTLDGGSNTGDGGMFTFSIECYAPNAYHYTGAFSLTPAEAPGGGG